MKAITIKKRNNKFIISLNFLGNIETIADNKEDIDIAVSEVLLCFIKASNEHGKGIVKEINDIVDDF